MTKSDKKGKNIEILKDIVVIFFIFVICLSNIFGSTYSNLDEIWNFNFARNVSNGLVPYKDFNMVPTPLLSLICGGFFKIFGQELIVMRSLAVVFLTSIFFIVYKILKKVTNDEIALLGLMAFLLLFKDILCIDYNYAVLLIALILVYIEILQKDDCFLKYRFKYDFIIGILAGVTILFKQTTGLAVILACIGYKIFKIRKKEEIKEFLKIAFTRLLGAIIPIILFIIYLLINGAMNDFISYAILGTTTFSNMILYKELFGQEIISWLALFLPITLIAMFITMFMKNTSKEVYIFFAYGISSSIVIYPISDKIHFCIGGLISFIAMIYILFDFVYSDDMFSKWNRKIRVALYGMFSFILMFIVLLNLFGALKVFDNQYIKATKEKELEHFIGIPENNGLKERIFKINKYIEKQKELGKKVYVLDAEAAIYMIPFNRYNKNYDLFTKGNFGKAGEQGIIEEIKNNEKDTIYLIKKENRNWQTPNEVCNYVIKNLEYIGDISIFWCFENS